MVQKTYFEDLKTQIDRYKSEAEFSRSQNIQRYQDSWLYYRTLKPAKNPQLISSYVEPVLKEATDKTMPTLLNIFCEDDNAAVKFRSKGFRPNPILTKAINESINRIFLRENAGYEVLSNAFKEALVTGDSFIKYFIDENHIEDVYKLEDWTPISSLTDMFSEWPDTTIPWEGSKKGAKKGLEWKTTTEKVVTGQDPVTGEPVETEVPTLWLKGKIKLLRVEKNLIVEQVPLINLYFDDSRGQDFKKCRYLSHRITVTVGDAISMGYDFEDLESASTVNSTTDEALSTSNLVIDGQLTSDNDFTESIIDPYERNIHLWEHYLYSSIPEGKTKLYQVMATDCEILSVEEVNRIPFVHGTFETIPGSFWGGSLYDICKQYQDELSGQKRLFHQGMANSALGRYSAIKGQYDRESLLNNRPGSVVEMNQPGAVTPFVAPPMPQGIMEQIQMTTQSKDNLISTSVGSTMNQEGLPQVAASTVAMVISNEQLKDKVVAKNLARTLITPLYEGIYELMRSEGYKILMEDGSVISAEQFPSVYEFLIDINTQHDDAAQAAQIANVASMVAQLTQTPSPIITPQNLFEISQRMLSQVNIEDGDKYFTNPAAQQPNEAAMLAQQEQEAQAKEVSRIQMEGAKAEIAYKIAQTAKIEFEISESVKLNAAKIKRDEEESLRKFKETEAKQDLAERKVDIQEKGIDAEILGFANGTPVDITGVKL